MLCFFISKVPLYLCAWFFNALLDRNGNTFEQFQQLQLFLLSHADVTKLAREREDAEEFDLAQCRLQQLVVRGDRRTADVVVTRNAAQLSHLQKT